MEFLPRVSHEQVEVTCCCLRMTVPREIAVQGRRRLRAFATSRSTKNNAIRSTIFPIISLDLSIFYIYRIGTKVPWSFMHQLLIHSSSDFRSPLAA